MGSHHSAREAYGQPAVTHVEFRPLTKIDPPSEAVLQCSTMLFTDIPRIRHRAKILAIGTTHPSVSMMYESVVGAMTQAPTETSFMSALKVTH